RSQEQPGVAKEGSGGEISMEENSLYSSRGAAGLEQAFEVTVRVTPSSQRCGLRGRCILRAAEEALELRQLQNQELLLLWPYRFLRRFGRDKVSGAWGRPGHGPASLGTDPCPPQVTFSFEAGRRCASGEGNFEFETRQGDEIFQAIEAAIEVQRGRGDPAAETPRPLDHARTGSRAQGPEEPKCPSGEARGEGKGLKGKPVIPPGAGEPSGSLQVPRGVDVPSSEPRDSRSAPALPDTARVESEYAEPFDTMAKSFLARLGCPQEGLPEPRSVPRDAGGGQQPPGRPKAEHIYDEPEEVKGEAWRLQAAPEEPPGLGWPYNAQRDDYAVPKRAGPLRQPFLLQGKEWLGDSDYDNVALKVAKK
ncbi:DOK2 protein, partial [Certhia familiaris]|nr:DOK2 protein [Certhia familiaris]